MLWGTGRGHPPNHPQSVTPRASKPCLLRRPQEQGSLLDLRETLLSEPRMGVSRRGTRHLASRRAPSAAICTVLMAALGSRAFTFERGTGFREAGSCPQPHSQPQGEPEPRLPAPDSDKDPEGRGWEEERAPGVMEVKGGVGSAPPWSLETTQPGHREGDAGGHSALTHPHVPVDVTEATLIGSVDLGTGLPVRALCTPPHPHHLAGALTSDHLCQATSMGGHTATLWGHMHGHLWL